MKSGWSSTTASRGRHITAQIWCSVTAASASATRPSTAISSAIALSEPGSGQRNQSPTPEEARPEYKACWGMVGRFEEDLKSFEKNGGNKSDPAWKDLFVYMIFARHRLSSM